VISRSDWGLYPPIEPYYTDFLKVSDLHTLYIEECGNPNGKPVVFLHGGPGGGTVPVYRQFFDPQQWRIILFDQRGCGKSRPHAELTDNTTWQLIADIEKIRQHFGIDHWVVFGGSWGSTLALAYAQTHPERCAGLILRGIFTLRPEEIRWFYQSGASYLYPDAWETYLAPIPVEEHDDLLSAYYRRLTHSDRAVQLEAARAWSIWEASTSKLIPDESLVDRFGEESFAIAFARIECHYFMNGGFFDTPDQIIANADRLRSLPGVIVQGRYDIVCPMKTAWELHRVWPEAEFIVVPNAGHSATEPGITHALIKATDDFLKL
jgi:proline iminopeptidase